MINNALNGKNLPVYGSGMNVRDWLYVEDHAKAIDLVAEKAKTGEVYNVGGHNEKKNIEIVTIIIDTLLEILPENDVRRDKLSHDLITYVEDRKGHDFRYAIAPDKIKSELGWEPETPFYKGIKLTIDWYLRNMDWMEHVTKGDYQKYYSEMYQV
jgi:dTDP-glucose 4,6-dehydratase